MDRVCGMPQRARVTIGADASESVRGCQLDSYSRLLSLLAAYYGAYKPIYMPRRVYTNLLFTKQRARYTSVRTAAVACAYGCECDRADVLAVNVYCRYTQYTAGVQGPCTAVTAVI